ncbi:hypothetical protein BT96DRAFT_986687 [Gymnopus androsaceus JB14]|uniref:Uncharacterized protein n=1 Tax=Gymnopus androsaceus JB14 TaxID=1447944 RepID=A0A6A4IBL2_9AGAR|nr:hypothetical protein BT96DRAFT_986687 [Gymnopus androsaceus JB14]
MIMGEVQLSTYSSLSDPNPYNAQYLDTLQKLAADHGIFIWPHPDANELAYSKSTLAYRLGKLRYKGHPVIRPTTLVLSCEQGFDLICSNHVVKQDKSAAGVNVFFKNKSQTVLEDFRAQWEATESYNWGYGQKPRFFAAPLNESLLSRGEVHCYFILGKLMRMVWTMPSNYTSANPDANNHADIMIDSDVSHLHPLKDIENHTPKPCAGVLENGAWHNMNSLSSAEGLKEVEDFAQFVVNHLVTQENLLETDKSQLVSTFRLFCRLDVCLEWSDEDSQFQLKVGEIQQAMCGLLDQDFSNSWVIANGFCNALKKDIIFGKYL